MTPPARRSAALLITVQLDRGGSVPWRATLAHYEDALESVAPHKEFANVDEAVTAVRSWLESFTRSAQP